MDHFPKVIQNCLFKHPVADEEVDGEELYKALGSKMGQPNKYSQKLKFSEVVKSVKTNRPRPPNPARRKWRRYYA